MSISPQGPRITDKNLNWRGVDETGDRYSHAAYLDNVSKVATYKRATFEALQLQPGQKVLDVGCGTGDDVLTLAALVGPGGRAFGLDSSRLMIEEARERACDLELPAEFVIGSVYDLPFADETFDAVRSDRVFQHLDDHARALSEMMRVVRPGGRINVCDPDWESGYIDTDLVSIERRIIQHFVDGSPNGRMGRQLYRLFLEAGLQDVQATPLPVVFTDVQVSLSVADFRHWGEIALEDGVISFGEKQAWDDEIDEAVETGIFLGGGTLFSVIGIRPS